MAGLLDYLSGGYGGGLLDRLMAHGVAPQPFVGGGRSFDETFAQFEPPASFASRFNATPNAPQPIAPSGRNFDDVFAQVPNRPNQAQPIAVGSYQMPRVGNADMFEPQQVNTPANAQPAAGQMQPGQTQQPQGGLPRALGGRPDGFFDRLNTGLQSIGNGGSVIGALTGNRTDPQSIGQQNLRAQFEALAPLVGPQKAMLAIMNPEAGKTILEQALSAKQKFTEIGVNADGSKQYGFVNDRDQTVKPYGAPGSNEPITMQGPDGKMIQMPAGADAKTWRNEITRINADVAAGKKTEVQAKAEIFGNKMELANQSITDGVGTSLAGKIASGLPLGNYAQSAEYQRYKQAASNFITALLRQESGAAIGKQEFDRYDREYMPQPGDSQAVLAQKAEARRVAIEGMKKGAGPGYKSPTESGGAAAPQYQEGATATNPQTGQKLTFRNGKWQ